MAETKTRTGPRGEAKTRHIVECAARVFAEKGYAATSVDDIARAAHASKQTLYSRFPAKSDLLKAAIEKACHDLAAERPSAPLPDDLEGVMLRLGKDVAERFALPRMHQLLEGVIGAKAAEPDAAMIFWETGPGLAASAIAARLNATGAGRDSERLARDFILDIAGPVIARGVFGPVAPADLEDLVSRTLATFRVRNPALFD